jgi:thiol-disulfide isomerase/thioredoxin
MTIAAPEAPPAAPAPRKPRKVFLLVGLVLAVGLGIGLFTSIGTPAKSGIPQVGGPVPSFSAPRLNGSGTVQVPADGGGGGTPAVLLFFGDWCTACHTELPPLAAAVRHQEAAGGPLAKVRVIGVDSEDTRQDGMAFVTASGIEFPVARDPDIAITNGDFYFEGDPYAVFVKGNGSISAIVPGPLSVARFTADEEKLVAGHG